MPTGSWIFAPSPGAISPIHASDASSRSNTSRKGTPSDSEIEANASDSALISLCLVSSEIGYGPTISAGHSARASLTMREVFSTD